MTTGEAQFYGGFEKNLGRLLEEAPVTATFLGDHRFECRLGDYTREGEERQRAMLSDWEREPHSFAPQGWSLDARIDHTLTTQVVKSLLRAVNRLSLVERNPSTPADEVVQGAYFLLLRVFAPLPQRMGNLLGRLREAPRVFAEGRSRIVAKDVPPVWAEGALRLLVEKSDLKPDDPRAEVCRYTQAPTQPQCYLMGKLEILEIVAAYRKAHPEASLRDTHDAILSCGSLPPRLMRNRLFPAG